MHSDYEYAVINFNTDGTITGVLSDSPAERMLKAHAWILWIAWGLLGFI
jgi:hypothetical protein